MTAATTRTTGVNRLKIRKNIDALRGDEVGGLEIEPPDNFLEKQVYKNVVIVVIQLEYTNLKNMQ